MRKSPGERSGFFNSGIVLWLVSSLWVFALLSMSLATAEASDRIIETVSGQSGGSLPATSCQLRSPAAVAVDGSGNLYIADSGNHRVRKVDTRGLMTTIAGNGYPGYSGDGASALAASLHNPSGLAVDAAGNVFIADTDNHRIRKVDTRGIISTIAGNGSPGYSGDSGDALSTTLHFPRGLALDASGSLFVADSSNQRVVKLQSDGIFSTTIVNLYFPQGVAVHPSGDIYITDSSNNRIIKIDTAGVMTPVAGKGKSAYSGDGGPATAAALMVPQAIAFGAGGELYIADTWNHVIRKVDSSGLINTVAGSEKALDLGDGGAAVSARLRSPSGLAMDSSGNIYVADTFNHRIRKIDKDGLITTVAGNGSTLHSGDGAPATTALLTSPHGLAVEGSGTVYIVDSGAHALRKIDTDGTFTTIAGTGEPAYSGDGDAATAAGLNNPTAIALEGTGTIYIADSNNHRIRKIDTQGIITTIAGNGRPEFSGEGAPAFSAGLHNPNGVHVDALGNIFIADTHNHRIRKIDTRGIISTVAGNGSPGYSGDGADALSARLFAPHAVVASGAGDLYIADTYNHCIRKVDAQGIISTVAGSGSPGYSGDGSDASSASLFSPYSIALDPSGFLIVADTYNYRLRRAHDAGVIETVAGSGSAGFSGDGGLATSAEIGRVHGVAVDELGNLYIAEKDGGRVRKIHDGIPAIPTYRTVCRAGCGYTSIQAAISASGNGDTVRVSDGIYNENINFQGRAVRVESLNGPAVTVIDGQGLDTVVRLITGEGSGSVLSGFTVRNGLAVFGGGVYLDGTSPVIENCRIENNEALSSGGGLYIANGAMPLLSGSYVVGNHASISGGGIYCGTGSSPVLKLSELAANWTEAHGGGIQCEGGSINVSESRLTGNLADLAGGAIAASGGSVLLLDRTTVTGSSSGGSGGGMYLSEDSSSILWNCLITHSTAGSQGSAFDLAQNASLFLYNCTVSDNLSATGGAVSATDSVGVVHNSIFWANSGNMDAIASQLTISYSDVYSDQGVFPGDGNTNTDPLFRAPGSSYRLQPSSPCIDVGSVTDSPSNDIEGRLRPLGAGVDLGAYETDSTGPVAYNQSLSAKQDASIEITLAAHDPDNETLVYALETVPGFGTVSGAPPLVTYTPDAGYFGSDSFTFKAGNGYKDSNIATVSITIQRHNTAPLAIHGTLAAMEDQCSPGALSATDDDGDSLTYRLVADGAKGRVTIQDAATGAFSYCSRPNTYGTDNFTFVAFDGTEYSNIQTVTVTIEPANDAPRAMSCRLTTNEDVPAEGVLFGWDPDEENITYFLVGNGKTGTAVITNPLTGSYTYTPAPDAYGSDTFRFAVSDGKADSNTSVVYVTINPADDSPTAVDLSVKAGQNASTPVTLSGRDPDGDSLTYSLLSNPSNGSLSGAPPRLIYTPNSDYLGPDSFTFKVNDGHSDSNTATVSLSVVPRILTNVVVQTVPERGTSELEVKLSGAPSSEQTISVARAEGDEDISVQQGASLIFNISNWDTYQIVTLSAAPDVDAVDGAATVRLTADQCVGIDVKVVEDDSWQQNLLCAFPDMNANGSTEIPVLKTDPILQTNTVSIKDGNTGQRITRFNCLTGYAAKAIAAINENGIPKLAVVGGNPDGAVKVLVKDPLGQSARSVFASLSGDILNAVSVLPDISGNGAPELAVLKTVMATGNVAVQVRDMATSKVLRYIRCLTMEIPQAMAVLPDVGGNGAPGLVVLGSSAVSHRAAAQIIDAMTGGAIRSISFGLSFRPHAMVVVQDTNGNGTPDILFGGSDTATGTVIIQLRDSLTGALLKTASLSTISVLQALKVMYDINGSSAPRFVALGIDATTGKSVVQISDVLTGTSLLTFSLGAIDEVCAMTLIPDANGLEEPQLAVLGMTPGTETMVLQVRDLSNWSILSQRAVP